jgi:long-subunit fatty acid transport protein
LNRWALLGIVLALAAAPAHGGPLDDPHVGGIGFGGPTTGDLTAVYWNPAALGLMQGTQVTVNTSGRLSSVTVRRSPINRLGEPGGDRTFPTVTGQTTHGPLSWPPGPGTFAAVGAAIGNRFTVALAAYTPFVQQTHFGPEDEQPTRYHAVDIDLRNIALVPALAFRIGSELRLGVAPGFLFSTGRLVFDEDTALDAGSGGLPCGAGPCDAENPAAAARYDVGSGLGTFDATLSFTVAGGIHYRRGPIEAGVSVSSRPLGNDGGGVQIDASRASVTPPARLGQTTVPCAENPSACVFGDIRYDLPDVITAGVTWHLTPRMALTGIVRFLTFSRHQTVSLRVVGAQSGGLRTNMLPERIVLYRGFHDVIEGRVRMERNFGTWLRLGLGLRADNGAVGAAHLSPAANGGPTVEPTVMAEVLVRSWLRLTLGYAFSITPEKSTGASIFNPRAASDCTDAQGNLATMACAERLAGQARPTAAGTYSGTQHLGTLQVTARF